MEIEIPKLQPQQSRLDKEWPKIQQFIRTLEPSIIQVAELTFLSRDQTQKLLVHFEGDKQKLQDIYYSDRDRILQQVGIPDPQVPVQTMKSTTCTWCFADCTPQDSSSLECGHMQCDVCWEEYLLQGFRSIQPFPKCLEEECHIRITETFLLTLIKKLGQNMNISMLYQQFQTALGKLIIKINKNKVACSHSECSYAYDPQIHMYPDMLVYDLQCPNEHQFCYNCGAEPHRPLQCKLVDNWNQKSGDGSMLDAFIRDNPNFFRCPKCSRVINYTQGCDQMTCGGLSGHGDKISGQGCGHVFCWRCFEPWEQHKGGWYNCNKFKPKGKTDEEQDNEKYMHYLQGYEDNRVMKMKRAQDCLEKATNDQIPDNYILEFEKIGIPTHQYDCVIKACKYLVKGRRALKWSYVYGYFVVKSEQRELYEHQQGIFEKSLQDLQTALTEELEDLFKSKDEKYVKEKEYYQNYKQKLNNKKSASEGFQNNFLVHLEETEIGAEYYNELIQNTKIPTPEDPGSDTSESEEMDDMYDDD